MDAVESVAQAILTRAQAQGYDLTPWYRKNEQKLRVYVGFMTKALGRIALSKPDQDRATVGYEQIRSSIAARVPDEVGWIDRNKNLLTALGMEISGQQRGVAQAAMVNAPGESFELRSAADRTAANIAAIKLLSTGRQFDDQDRRIMAGYSGWGGLSIKSALDELPQGWVPESRALIHEYYTPQLIADAIAATLFDYQERLGGSTGIINALEPSAGIGRMINAFRLKEWPSIRWTAIEFSHISATLLAAIRPEVHVVESSFEEYVHANPDKLGQFDLVVSNPPYGIRGRHQTIDRDKSYRESKAYAYQVRRGIDFLRKDGIGVFLIPYGFMSGKSPAFRQLRAKVLKRAHLMAAYRLPSETSEGKSLFPGALLVVDLIFLRSRGGTLDEVPQADEFIEQGQYFAVMRENILGQEAGAQGEEDEQARRPRFGYQVRGHFSSLPPLVEREECRDCEVTPQKVLPAKPANQALPDSAQHAVALAERLTSYLEWLAAGDSESIRLAQSAHAELLADLEAWQAQPRELREADLKFSKSAPALAALRNVVSRGAILPELAQAPVFQEGYSGTVEDVAALAAWLWRRARKLSIEQLLEAHRKIGGALSADALHTELRNLGWCEDFGAASPLMPPDQYFSGSLWPKYDRAVAAARAGNAAASSQAARLIQLINPATFGDLRLEPRLGWLPLSVVEEWVNAITKARGNYKLEREDGFLTLEGVKYLDLTEQSDNLRLVLGYLNHDMAYFSPSRTKEESLDKKRIEVAERFKEHFTEWLDKNLQAQELIVEAHNRLFRGWLPPKYESENLPLARWNKSAPLWPYQNAAVRRLVANRGGGLFFDVGLGKTRTLLAALALSRQLGQARRPLIAAPNSLVYNWAGEIEKVLPNFRYVVIGMRLKVVSRGERKGEVISEADDPQDRAAKWHRFQLGLYDIAIVAYSAFPRTELEIEQVMSVVKTVPAVQRELKLKVREIERRIEVLQKKAKKKKITEKEQAELADLLKTYSSQAGTERKAAILVEKEEARAAEWVELPEGWEPDPGISFRSLGVDFLGYDESHVGKNLWTSGAREGGDPRFLGSPQEGSYIAWQMYLRAFIVRSHTGGSGIYLADATPAKNSPLEYLSVLSLIDSEIWKKLGISDPEQYITQYLSIENRLIIDSDLEPREVPCVIGFKNLDQLREVLFRYGEFQNAQTVGLKLPEPKYHRVWVDMDEDQEEKYRIYLEAYQEAIASIKNDPSARFKALGLIQRMALVAVHAELDEGPGGAQAQLPLVTRLRELVEETADVAREAADESMDVEGVSGAAPEHSERRRKRPKKIKWEFSNAHLATKYSSPKFIAIATLIMQRKDCGHIIFLENVAAHYWMQQILIKYGIKEGRIGILNAETAKDSATRQRIAEGFTKDPIRYDVIIGNKIAYEGMNLQTRTCSISHGDLPYEPATLQQRNGRGLRMGNRLDVIDIYYILAKRSTDARRIQLITGKREWQSAILEATSTDANNPAAQIDVSPEDWLISLSRDEEKTRALILTKKLEAQKEENKRLIKVAWASIRQIGLKQQDWRSAKDEFLRVKLEADIAKITNDLSQFDPLIWPWKIIAGELSAHRVFSFGPARDGAVWESARYLKRHPDGEVYSGGEFGRIVDQPKQIGYRQYGKLSWEDFDLSDARDVWASTVPTDWIGQWPTFEEELSSAVQEFDRVIKYKGVDAFSELALYRANDRFTADLWTKFGTPIVGALFAAHDYDIAKIPARGPSGPLQSVLDLTKPADVYPFTASGYLEFLGDARKFRSLKFSEIDGMVDWWWGRRPPRDLLAEKKDEDAHGRAGQENEGTRPDDQ